MILGHVSVSYLVTQHEVDFALSVGLPGVGAHYLHTDIRPTWRGEPSSVGYASWWARGNCLCRVTASGVSDLGMVRS